MRKLLTTLFLTTFICMPLKANETNTNFNATSKINNSCLLSVANLDFGNYSATSSITATSAIKIKCNNNVISIIAIDGGGWTNGKNSIPFGFKELSSGTIWHRNLPHIETSSSVLFYNLFQDAEKTIPYGGNGTLVYTSNARPKITHDGSEKTLPIYGGLGGQQYVKAGSYSVSLTVQVSF